MGRRDGGEGEGVEAVRAAARRGRRHAGGRAPRKLGRGLSDADRAAGAGRARRIAVVEPEPAHATGRRDDRQAAAHRVHDLRRNARVVEERCDEDAVALEARVELVTRQPADQVNLLGFWFVSCFGFKKRVGGAGSGEREARERGAKLSATVEKRTREGAPVR